MTAKPTVVYLFSVAESIGAVTAKNHLVVHNPAGSGKTLGLATAFMSNVALAATTITAPMRGFRCTYVSGGTLQANSAILKFNSTHPDSVAEIYTDNPTVTLGAAVLNSPPNVEKRTSDVHVAQAEGALLILQPGESFVLRQAAFTVDIFWNISIAWTERP